MRAEIAEVRTEIASLDTRLSTQIGSLDTRLSTQIAEVRTEVAGVRTEIGNLEARLIKWIVGTVLATAAATATIAGAVVAVLRFLSAPVP